MSGLKTSEHKQHEASGQHSSERSAQPNRMGLVYNVQALQRTAGNQAVTHLLQQRDSSPIPADDISPVVHDVPNSPTQQSDGSTHSVMKSRFAQDLSRVQIHDVAPVMLQAKLTIGQVGDKYEQEADRVADTIMRMPNNSTDSEAATYPSPIQQLDLAVQKALRRQPTPGAGAKPNNDDEDEDLMLMRKEANTTPSTDNAHTAPPTVHSVLNSGGGQPLDIATRAFMEPRFEQDFSQVRVHSDEQAAESARSVNALAYTVGRDVVFGRGQYAPATGEGKRLLAHELAHVIQQNELYQNDLSHSPNKVYLQRKKNPAEQKPPEEPSEEEQTEINDLAGTIMDIVQEDMEKPLQFEENWGKIQQQIIHPTLITPSSKKKEKLFPELYNNNDLVNRLLKLKKEWRTLVAKKIKEQLLENISDVPHPTTGKPIDYQQEFKDLQPIIRNAFSIEHYIFVRDALIRKFSPTFDFEDAKKNIGQYYGTLVKANFPTAKSKSSDALVHPLLQVRLQKALNLLWNLGWSPEEIDGRIETIRTLLGLDVRANVNAPKVKAEKSKDAKATEEGEEAQVNLSNHSFGWAIDINPSFNPNVHQSDFPARLVEGFTYEDVYKGKNVQTIRPELALPKGKRSGKLASNLPQPTVEQTLTAVKGLYEASKKFQRVYENKASFSHGLVDYVKDKGKLHTPNINKDTLYTAVANAYKEQVNRREQEKHSKGKPKQSGPALPRSEYLLSILTSATGVERANAEEIASFMLEAYEVFVKSREIKTLQEDPHTSAEQSTIEPATVPKAVEIEGKKVESQVQGTKATIAAHGFINIVPELITALIHSDGGGLKWLGAAEGVKDFMHFELKKGDQPKMPGDKA